MNDKQIKIATCHTCHWPIYQGDLIHHSSTGSHSGTVDTYGASQQAGGGTTFHGSTGTYSGTSHTEGWVQCQWCLNEYGKELTVLKAWKWKWGLIIWITVPSIMTIIGIVSIGINNGILGGLVFGLFISAGIWWVAKKFFAPEANRYKFRSYRRRE